MATVPFIIERKVQYHGIWNTPGLKVTDQFLKAISEQYISKPSCPTFLTLSSSSITLVVFRNNGDELRRDHISMDALREMAVNAFDPRCLMILYINSKSQYSVIVCSCLDPKEPLNITAAYKKLKNLQLLNQHDNQNEEQQNWILRPSPVDNVENGDISSQNGMDVTDSSQDKTFLGRNRTVSGLMNETFAFLNNEDERITDEDVFGDVEDVSREPVNADECKNDAFHVRLQVCLEYSSSNMGSMSSRTSISSLQSLSDALPDISMNGLTPHSDISSDEFCINEMTDEEESNGITNGVHKEGEINDGQTSEDDGPVEDKKSNRKGVVKTEDNANYDYRSTGTQTSHMGTGRYKKRPGSMGSSNIYRDMAAHRRHAPPSAAASVAPTILRSSSARSSTPSQPVINGSLLRARPQSFHSGVSYNSLFLPRHIHVSSTSVSKPIENVYHSLSRSHHRRSSASHHHGHRNRRVLVHTSSRHHNPLSS